jgi:hypothetical protein
MSASDCIAAVEDGNIAEGNAVVNSTPASKPGRAMISGAATAVSAAGPDHHCQARTS